MSVYGYKILVAWTIIKKNNKFIFFHLRVMLRNSIALSYSSVSWIVCNTCFKAKGVQDFSWTCVYTLVRDFKVGKRKLTIIILFFFFYYICVCVFYSACIWLKRIPSKLCIFIRMQIHGQLLVIISLMWFFDSNKHTYNMYLVI